MIQIKFVILRAMKAFEIQMQISSNTCYRKHSEFELWAHYTPSKNQVHIELKVYEEDGRIKVYDNLISITMEGKTQLEGREIFQFLCLEKEYQVYPMKGGITVEVIDLLSGGRTSKSFISFKLWEKKSGPSSNNLMLIRMMNDKNEKGSVKQIEGDEWECEPISHDTYKNRFEANLNVKEHKINTKLTFKEGREGGKNEFMTVFDEKKLGNDFKIIFENIENLFEHLRSQDNYEVLEKKGTIKILNEPQNSNQLELLRKRARQRRQPVNKEEKRSKSQSKSQGKSRSKNDSEGLNRSEVEEIISKMKKDFSEKRKASNDKMNDLFKEFQERIGREMKELRLNKQNKEKQEKGKKQLDYKSLHKILKESEAKLSLEINKCKTDLSTLITRTKIVLESEYKEGDRALNEHLEEMINALRVSLEEKNRKREVDLKEKSLKNNRSVSRHKLDWNSIEVDTSSSQLKKFKIELGNVIIYVGPWEWTQLYTRTIIPHGKVSILKFKIIKSTYNAIAIGVSDHENMAHKSSLPFKNCIAYWGDRYVWEQQKVKEEGKGFGTGDLIEMRVDTVVGVVSWLVGSEICAQYSSPTLRDRSLHLIGYIEMYDEGDSIEFLSSQIAD